MDDGKFYNIICSNDTIVFMDHIAVIKRANMRHVHSMLLMDNGLEVTSEHTLEEWQCILKKIVK